MKKREGKAGKAGDFGKLYYDRERRNAGLGGVKSVGNFSKVQKKVTNPQLGVAFMYFIKKVA
ncbi:hypothetical protein [Neobacillus sp.]|uniref:hypothetical protein n=1 Tax=Neobacillus sp. TaxID=2675273 RepID=UPI00289B5FF6|nr:hypothetical protein [Neobacillus sp.]